MNCPRNEEVSAYMDDAMEAREREGFSNHLHTCAACRGRLDALLALRAQLRELPSPALGFDLAAQFEDRLRMAPVRARPARGRGFGWIPAGLTVALSLAVGGWVGGLLVAGASSAPPAAVRVFDPTPPGGLCAAPELCRLSKGIQ